MKRNKRGLLDQPNGGTTSTQDAVACGFGAPGEPRPNRNTTEPPQLPTGFWVDADKKGWRH